MKKYRKHITMIVVLAMLLATALPVMADGAATGAYTIIVSNGDDTGISIAGHTFHAFQIFAADDVTSFSVTDDFRGFFIGNYMVAGDGSGTVYNFEQYLKIIDEYESTYIVDGVDDGTASPADYADYDTALNNYNQLAGQYMDSYKNNMYTLAEQIRTYLDTYGAYAVSGGISCKAHAEAVSNDDDTESATLTGLDSGYYFIFDQASTSNGIGIAASGAFVPITTASDYITTVSVKQNVPTMDKTIYHDDAGVWDVVGDHQIGDDVQFRIISTLPTNIDDYTDTVENATAIEKYDYILTDTMSEGLAYNGDLKIYTDAEGVNEVSAAYYEIDTSDADTTFVLTFNAINFLADNPDSITLYTFYSAKLTEDAVVASEYDQNTASLQYSSNPSEAEDYGYAESTVFHYTFALDVNKVDESGNGLAGARFGLFDVDGYAIPLSKGEVDYSTGVVTYYYDISATAADSDGGYIITETIALTEDGTENGTPTGVSVTGKFQIYGLNDQTWYTLREVEAPTGYNAADQFDIYFTVTYNSLGTEITHFTDGSAYVYTSQDVTGDWGSSSTIINRLKIYLPETGGVGTVVFQVGGGALMLGAVAMLFISKRKKEEN